jgi:hypothetical protein
MALPFFAEFGWEPLILKVNPEEQEGLKDPVLCRTIPDSIRTWQAASVPLGLTSWSGLRNVGLRSYLSLARLGDQIISSEQPDLAFFSTTMFPLMTLGRYWQGRHGLPYVLDYQDPWRKQRRQRGRCKEGLGTDNRSVGLKRRLSDFAARVLEPIALRRVAHIVSVSPAYPKDLAAAYAWLKHEQFTILPFGASETDYEFLKQHPVRQTAFNPRDGKRHWVYVGRGGGDMTVALRALFKSLAEARKREPLVMAGLRLHFFGTDYAAKGRAEKTVEPLARKEGVTDLVEEVTDRIPYFEALQSLLDADALVVPGSEDPGYTASKICPYILARKPLLAVFHERSSVVEILQKTRAGTVVSFRSGEAPESIASRILAAGWIQNPTVPNTLWSEFEPYTAREMTRRLCLLFDSCRNP